MWAHKCKQYYRIGIIFILQSTMYFFRLKFFFKHYIKGYQGTVYSLRGKFHCTGHLTAKGGCGFIIEISRTQHLNQGMQFIIHYASADQLSPTCALQQQVSQFWRPHPLHWKDTSNRPALPHTGRRLSSSKVFSSSKRSESQPWKGGRGFAPAFLDQLGPSFIPLTN